MFTTIGRYVLGLWGGGRPPVPQEEAPTATEATTTTPASATGEGHGNAPVRERETDVQGASTAETSLPVLVRPTVSDDEEGSPEEEGPSEEAAKEGLTLLSGAATGDGASSSPGKRSRVHDDGPAEGDHDGAAPVVAPIPPATAKEVPAQQHRPKRQRRTAHHPATGTVPPVVAVASS